MRCIHCGVEIKPLMHFKQYSGFSTCIKCKSVYWLGQDYYTKEEDDRHVPDNTARYPVR